MTGKRLTVVVPDEIHWRLKSKSAKLRRNMTDVVIQLLSEWLEDDDPDGEDEGQLKLFDEGES